jgi:hypothetical protein
MGATGAQTPATYAVRKCTPWRSGVAAGAVIVLGGARVGVPGQNLGIAQRHPGVQGVGDRSMPQRVRADVARDAGGLGDPNHHRSVTVTWSHDGTESACGAPRIPVHQTWTPVAVTGVGNDETAGGNCGGGDVRQAAK